MQWTLTSVYPTVEVFTLFSSFSQPCTDSLLSNRGWGHAEAFVLLQALTSSLPLLQTPFYERYRKTVFWDWQPCVWPNWNRLRGSRFNCVRLRESYVEIQKYIPSMWYLKLCFLRKAEKILQRLNEVIDSISRWTNLRCREQYLAHWRAIDITKK